MFIDNLYSIDVIYTEYLCGQKQYKEEKEFFDIDTFYRFLGELRFRAWEHNTLHFDIDIFGYDSKHERLFSIYGAI